MSFGPAIAFGLPMISPVNLISQRNGHIVQLPGSLFRAFDLFHIASSSTLAMHGLTQGINLRLPKSLWQSWNIDPGKVDPTAARGLSLKMSSGWRCRRGRA